MRRKSFHIYYGTLILLLLFFYSNPQISSAQASTNDVSIADAVNADLAVNGYLDNISVSYDDSNPANEITINETRHWLPASTVKLFTAMYAFKKISDHQLSLWDTISADAKNVVTTELVTDELPTIQTGDILTMDRLIRQMITQSDNTAFNILLDRLDRQKITEYIHTLGLAHSAIGSKLNLDESQSQYEFDAPGYGINTTTSDDYTKAFLLIKKNKIAGAKDLFEILKQQKLRYMLPLFLPKDVVVANKTGDLAPLFHDGGIITDSKNSYVLSIFSNVGDPNIIAHISELIYTKNIDLVGAAPKNVPTQKNQNPAIDPLVAQGYFPTAHVLGANTESIPSQPITAADLGITAKDLSLTENTKTLPPVTIPADSAFHFLVPAYQFLKKTVAFTSEAKVQVDIDSLSLQLAEAKEQKDKGNNKLANEILHTMQNKLVDTAHNKAIIADPIIQNALQATSETRFSLLGDELKHAKESERIALIKEIAGQAKSTLKNVQPFIPDASNATNPSQKPLIGSVTSVMATTATVKTPGGQEITIPLNSTAIKIRSKEILPSPSGEPLTAVTPGSYITPTPSIAPLQVGTTVALVGSSNGKVFIPSFILTNVPRQLAAPQPVTVVKVNTKNDTMVVSENGVPIQVNITNQTIVKGTDTSISLKTIKPGDIVIVHGEPLVSPSVSPVVPSNGEVPTIQPSGISIKNEMTKPAIQPLVHSADGHTSMPSMSVGIPTSSTSHIGSQITNNPIQKTNSGSTNTVNASSSNSNTNLAHPAIQTLPAAVQQFQPAATQVAPPKIQPQVIQSTSIKVIEKAQDVKPNQPAPQLQSKPSINTTTPQAQSQPKSPPSNSSQSQSSTQQSTIQKDDKKEK